MSRLTQRLPTHNPSPSPILYPQSGPSSGRASPHPRALQAGGPGSGLGLGISGSSTPSSNQYSESPYGGGMGSNGGMNGSGYTRATHDVETQNDERLEGLLGKVKILKDITVGIGNEVRDSNLTLGNMNDSFGSASNLLNSTFRRMNKMAGRQGGNWCWFMGFLALCMWIFVIVWWLRR